MKHCLITWLTALATSTASSALYACPEESVDVAMATSPDAGSTILANGMTTQSGALAHVTYVPSSPTRVWSFYPAFPNADGYLHERRTRLHGNSFQWLRYDDGK